MTGSALVAAGACAAVVLLLMDAGRRRGTGPRPRRLVDAAGPMAAALRLRLRGAARQARVRADCLDLLDALAAELHAGRPGPAALQRAAAPHPALLAHTLGAHRLGGDLPAALEVDAATAGAPVLRRLAACWRVGEATGAGLADAVSRLAVSSRESERVRLELAARTAEPRATMRVLAALPLFGLLLGAGLGADSVGWLIGAPAGRVALGLGLVLEITGVLWARRMIGSVESAL